MVLKFHDDRKDIILEAFRDPLSSGPPSAVTLWMCVKSNDIQKFQTQFANMTRKEMEDRLIRADELRFGYEMNLNSKWEMVANNLDPEPILVECSLEMLKAILNPLKWFNADAKIKLFTSLHQGGEEGTNYIIGLILRIIRKQSADYIEKIKEVFSGFDSTQKVSMLWLDASRTFKEVVKRNCVEVVQFFFEGLNWQQKERITVPMLEEAATCGNLKMMRILLKGFSEDQIKNFFNHTLIRNIYDKKYYDVLLSVLLEYNIDLTPYYALPALLPALPVLHGNYNYTSALMPYRTLIESDIRKFLNVQGIPDIVVDYLGLPAKPKAQVQVKPAAS